MPPKVRAAFEMFIALGAERSLTNLEKFSVAQGTRIPLPTLNRWSQKYGWIELAKLTDGEISKQIASNAAPQHIARIDKALEAFEFMKDGFYERVKSGEIKIRDIPEFITVLKAEGVLRGESAGKDPEGESGTVINNFLGIDRDQMVKLARLSQGLPTEINVTP